MASRGLGAVLCGAAVWRQQSRARARVWMIMCGRRWLQGCYAKSGRACCSVVHRGVYSGASKREFPQPCVVWARVWQTRLSAAQLP